MDRRPKNDEHLAREHRSDDPVGAAEPPEGQGSDAKNPGGSRMDRPLAGRSGHRARKSTDGQSEEE